MHIQRLGSLALMYVQRLTELMTASDLFRDSINCSLALMLGSKLPKLMISDVKLRCRRLKLCQYND
jgi:hypothetical protein